MQPANPITPRDPILIVGGGIGGLVLAHALKNKSIPFRIFERDPALDYRPQGYRFHLRSPGAQALFTCLDPDVLQNLKWASPENRGPENGRALFARSGKENEEFMKLAPQSKPDLNVDRSSLRQVLSEGVGVEFGKRFDCYDIQADAIIAKFKDGTVARGSLLVGADGIKSSVRAKLLPDYELLDTQGRWLWGKSDLTPEIASKLPKGAAKGIIGAQDKIEGSDIPVTLLAESIIFDRSANNPRQDTLPQDYIYWVLQSAKQTIQVEDAQFFSLDSKDAVKLAQQLTSDWAPELRAIFDHCIPGSVAVQPVTSGDPTVPIYDGKGRVTLLGDAIHQMPPTAGAGATSAIQDAKWLADAIEEDGVTRQSLDKYEQKMRKNGIEAIASSELRSAKMFGAPSFAEMDRIKP